MAAPISEQIVAAVAARIATITVANGYEQTIGEVQRPKRTGEAYRPVQLGAVVLVASHTRAPEYDMVGYPAAIAWRLGVGIDVVYRLSEASATAIDTVLNTAIADVHKAAMTDGTWGGLAIMTELGAVDYPAAGEQAEGATVMLEIIYRVSETDPYTARN